MKSFGYIPLWKRVMVTLVLACVTSAELHAQYPKNYSFTSRTGQPRPWNFVAENLMYYSTLWDLKNGTRVRQFEAAWGFSSISADGRLMVSAPGGGSETGEPAGSFPVVLWHMSSGKEIRRFDYQNNGKAVPTVEYSATGSVELSGDGHRLLIGWSGAQIWDVQSGVKLFTLPGIIAASFSPDNRQILAVMAHGAEVVDSSSGRTLCQFSDNAQFFNDAEFSHDGSTIVTAARDSIAIWDSRTCQRLRSIPAITNSFAKAAYSDNDLTIVVNIAKPAAAEIIDPRSGETIRKILPPGAAYVTDIAINSDGSRVLTRQTVFRRRDITYTSLWDASSGKELHRFEDEDMAHFWVVGFSPSGGSVVVVGNGHPLSLWDSETGDLIRQYHTTDQAGLN